MSIKMEKLVALCHRRGFIFQSSEIYGGINGFWDYGPLGVELKRNLKDAWWQDIVRCPQGGPEDRPISMVGLDSTIIMNRRVWEASGHATGFCDAMSACKGCKKLFRTDFLTDRVVCPECGGVLTEPRQFNLMFQTHAGAVQDDASMTYLRPETAQGIFANFRNVTDTSRVKIPFGIAQIGKAFRNEVTPRNFTFRSREFEQMEIEFFIRPDTAGEWYQFWRDTRFKWWQSIGLAGTNLQLREHDRDELAHYAKDGAGTSDIEYKFPFTDPGFGELEGVAHRTDFDLRQHAEFSGLGDKLKYYDQEKNERYFPHVIEPSAGADRGTLALLCEAYTDDPGRPSGVVMKFHPRMAPIKAAIFPLVDKDGMSEIATNLYTDLRKTWNVQLDIKQNIGKRYARMDEAGTPFCFTIDTQTLSDQTVTVRFRDTLEQQRVHISQVRAFLYTAIGNP